jgi:hypothetical protein
VLIAVPFRDGGCRHRARAWDTVSAHLRRVLPGVEVRVVDDGGHPFARGASLNLAFDGLAPDDVVIACDADLVIDGDQLFEAARLAAEAPGMVVPFDRMEYVTRTGGRQSWPLSPTMPMLGGCNVLSRRTWELAGGWHPRFRGWGCEDVAMATQCNALAGLTRRVPGTATHLYHPKAKAYVDDALVAANGALMRRINEAAADPDRLRALLEEAT